MSASGPCLECVYKHLAQAMIIHEEEIPLGYGEDKQRVIGHLAEASRHALQKHYELADGLRTLRKAYMADTSGKMYPAYTKILDFVELLIACEKKELPFPDLPEHLANGKMAVQPTP